MQESKQETQFRIGGCYRQKDGGVVMLREPRPVDHMGSGFAWATPTDCGDYGYGFRRLADGTDEGSWWAGESRALIPGELHQVDGQWVPLEEKQERDHDLDWAIEYLLANRPARVDPNAAMIARDGPAKPAPAVIAPAPLITTKPPIAGLTRVSAQDHRVGGWGFVR